MMVWLRDPKRCIGDIEQTNGGNWFATAHVLQQWAGNVFIPIGEQALGAFRSKQQARDAVIAYSTGSPVEGRIETHVLLGSRVVGQTGETAE
jgi:hypothetical protein